MDIPSLSLPADNALPEVKMKVSQIKSIDMYLLKYHIDKILVHNPSSNFFLDYHYLPGHQHKEGMDCILHQHHY